MTPPDPAMAASTCPDTAAPELGAAIAAVSAAVDMTRAAQGRLAAGSTLTKDDSSPVTVADFAAQAVVCAVLTARLGAVPVVGEEHPDDLAERHDLLDGVVALTDGALPTERADRNRVLEWIGLGGHDATAERYWTLDPIDGTKGFLRGDQFAIALALIERGQVVLGVLGCPNLPQPDGSVGGVYAADARGAARVDGDTVVPIRVAAPASMAEARLCESVESGHSDHSHAAAIAERLGIRAEPYRIDSQCKYAAVARGDASIYLRLPTRPDYREKIWDHAAGKFVVEQAGGRVTDVDGAELAFGNGPRLAAGTGVVATSGEIHDDVIAAVRSVLAR